MAEVQTVTLFWALKKINFQKTKYDSSRNKSRSVIWMTLNGSLCSVFACRQPFPAGDRVTFNGKECVCQKCTQPLPANSPAPIQAVHSQYPATRITSPAQHHSHTRRHHKTNKLFTGSRSLRFSVVTFIKSCCDASALRLFHPLFHPLLRLLRLRERVQERAVAGGAGQALAPWLLQVQSLQQGAQRRVHQQVSREVWHADDDVITDLSCQVSSIKRSVLKFVSLK